MLEIDVLVPAIWDTALDEVGITDDSCPPILDVEFGEV